MTTACVKPYRIPPVKDLLSGSGDGVCPVIAFPHGNSATTIKVREAEDAARAGGTEIDMVANVGKVPSEDRAYVSREIKAVNEALTAHGAILLEAQKTGIR